MHSRPGFFKEYNPMWSFLDKRFEDILGSIMLAVMVTITFLNVIVRYCTNFSFA